VLGLPQGKIQASCTSYLPRTGKTTSKASGCKIASLPETI